MNPLTPEQKEQAAKALYEVYYCHGDAAYTKAGIDLLQRELAKVNLAIQPIEKKPLLKDLPACG